MKLHKIIFPILFALTVCIMPVKSACDPSYKIDQFIAAHPEIETALQNPAMLNDWLNLNESKLMNTLSYYAAGNISVYQTTLNNGSTLTIWFLSNVDSASTVNPLPATTNNFFDATSYNKRLDSTLYTVRVRENGTGGSDSVRIRRIGAFNLTNKFSSLIDTLIFGPGNVGNIDAIDTLASNKGTPYQANLKVTGTKNTYMYPYWSFCIDGILCQGPSVLIFIWNVQSTTSKQ